MKGTNKAKIMKLFDYFKDAYALNHEHRRQLYRPQIFYLLLRGGLVVLLGFYMADLSRTMSPFIGQTSFRKFMALFWGEYQGAPFLLTLATLVVLLFGATYVEAGLYNIYAKLNRGEEMPVFANGANRYFLSFLGGNILIIGFWLVIALPYVVVGLFTLTLGFVWLPILVGAMLMVWKASIVSDDVGVFRAIGNSLAFGKRHFLPATVFIILQSAITNISHGASGQTSRFNRSFNTSGGDGGVSTMPFEGDMPDFGMSYGFLDYMGDFLYWAILIVTLLTAVIALVAGLVHMLFEIFFGLSTVVIYQDDWFVPQPDAAVTFSDEVPEEMSAPTESPTYNAPDGDMPDPSEEVEQ